tara:strand:- start:22 stop:498 length:477 start_codon:yes stop_codon:yes gene_type:complete
MHPTRIFKAPEELQEAWGEYKECLLTAAKLWPKVQYVGRDGKRVEDYPVLPITLDGFYVFCREVVKGKPRYGEVEQYFTNQGGRYDDFVGICRACKQERRNHQIIGGMVGAFNPSITQRLNGLADKKEVDAKVDVPIFKGIDLDVPRDNSTGEDSGTS